MFSIQFSIGIWLIILGMVLGFNHQALGAEVLKNPIVVLLLFAIVIYLFEEIAVKLFKTYTAIYDKKPFPWEHFLLFLCALFSLPNFFSVFMGYVEFSHQFSLMLLWAFGTLIVLTVLFVIGDVLRNSKNKKKNSKAS